MAVSKLEPELRDSIVSQYGDAVQRVYFNKGLWGRPGLISIICSTPKSQCMCVYATGHHSLITGLNEMLFWNEMLCDFRSIMSLFIDLFLWFQLFLFFSLELNRYKGAVCALVKKPNDVISGTAHFFDRLKLTLVCPSWCDSCLTALNLKTKTLKKDIQTSQTSLQSVPSTKWQEQQHCGGVFSVFLKPTLIYYQTRKVLAVWCGHCEIKMEDTALFCQNACRCITTCLHDLSEWFNSWIMCKLRLVPQSSI